MYSLDKISLLKWSAYAESNLLPAVNKLKKGMKMHIPQWLKSYQSIENINESMKIALLAAIITALVCYMIRKLWLMASQPEILEKPLLTESTKQKIFSYLTKSLQQTEQLALPENYKIALRARELERKLRPQPEMIAHFYPHPKPLSIDEISFIQTVVEDPQSESIKECLLIKEVIEDIRMQQVEVVQERVEDYLMGPVEKA